MTGDGGALELIRISDLGSDGMVSVDSDGDGDGDGYDGCRTMDGYELLTERKTKNKGDQASYGGRDGEGDLGEMACKYWPQNDM
jgi:hypothetical protein